MSQKSAVRFNSLCARWGRATILSANVGHCFFRLFNPRYAHYVSLSYQQLPFETIKSVILGRCEREVLLLGGSENLWRERDHIFSSRRAYAQLIRKEIDFCVVSLHVDTTYAISFDATCLPSTGCDDFDEPSSPKGSMCTQWSLQVYASVALDNGINCVL